MPRLAPDQVRAKRDLLDEQRRNGTLDIPTAVRLMREIMQLSQAEFGRRFGLSQKQVSLIESGRANPTQELLNRVGRPFRLIVGFIGQDR